MSRDTAGWSCGTCGSDQSMPMFVATRPPVADHMSRRVYFEEVEALSLLEIAGLFAENAGGEQNAARSMFAAGATATSKTQRVPLSPPPCKVCWEQRCMLTVRATASPGSTRSYLRNTAGRGYVGSVACAAMTFRTHPVANEIVLSGINQHSVPVR